VLLTCPGCGVSTEPLKFRTEWGSGGSFRCPHCNQLLRYSKRYGLAMWIGSLPVAAGIPYLFGIRYQDNTILYFAVGLLSWPVIRLLLTGIVARIIGPPKLEIPDPKGPPELFNKRRW
jgi:hypothetical protein